MNKIYEVKEFSLEAINTILNKEAAVLRVRNFYAKEKCKNITAHLLADDNKGRFAKASQIQRIGMPHYDIVDAESFKKYHDEAIHNIQYIREAYSPYLSPIDYFRLLLDEVWPAGAKLEILYGKKCFVGLCRVIDEHTELLPHIDKLSRDSHDSFSAHSLLEQLAVNMFIATPEKGGELELWLREPEDALYEQQLSETQSYHVNKTVLGEADVVIKPEVGDLIIFSSRYYHGVRAGENGKRASIAAFIGYRGQHSPLTLWS